MALWCVVFVLAGLGPDPVDLYRSGDVAGADALVRQRAGELARSGASAIAALAELGHLAEAQWRYDLAASVYEQARKLATDDPALEATLLTDLARVDRIQNDLRAAKDAATRALALRERAKVPPDLSLTELLGVLSYTTAAEQDYEAGEKQARRAVEVADGLNDPTARASARNNLAAFLRFRGEAVAAERVYREAVRLYRDAKAEKSAGMAAAAHNLTVLLLNGSNTSGAVARDLVEFEELAATAAEASLGLRHPFTAQTLDTLSLVYRQTGRGGRSVEAAERAKLARGLAASFCVNALGSDGCLRACGTNHKCPATLECIALEEVKGVSVPTAAACARRCEPVGSTAGCPSGQVCSQLQREGHLFPYGVCAPK